MKLKHISLQQTQIDQDLTREKIYDTSLLVEFVNQLQVAAILSDKPNTCDYKFMHSVDDDMAICNGYVNRTSQFKWKM